MTTEISGKGKHCEGHYTSDQWRGFPDVKQTEAKRLVRGGGEEGAGVVPFP